MLSSTSSTSSSTASRWWHTRADTDDYDDNISWRTAFDDACPLGIDLAAAARTPLISTLTVFPTDARLVKEAAVEEDDETDDLFADVVPNLLALVDDVAKVQPAPAKPAPVAAAVVTDDDATDEEAKARAPCAARATRSAAPETCASSSTARRARRRKPPRPTRADAACAEFAAAC